MGRQIFPFSFSLTFTGDCVMIAVLLIRIMSNGMEKPEKGRHL